MHIQNMQPAQPHNILSKQIKTKANLNPSAYTILPLILTAN